MGSMHERWVSSYPQLLFFALVILCRVTNVSYAYAFLGYIGNSVVNGGLKQVFRHMIGDAGNRPVPHSPSTVFDAAVVAIWPEYKNNNAYGFPSGHAQSVGYFVAFAHQFLPWRTWHPVWIAAALAVAAGLMWTRVAFRRHTAVQVLFGFAFGVITFRAFHRVWTA
jgi:membrane-associated phospholipid phosphatase